MPHNGGFRDVRYVDVVISCTPWTAVHVRDEMTRITMAEALQARGFSRCTLTASSPRGPFLATVGDLQGRGATPVHALNAALDKVPA